MQTRSGEFLRITDVCSGTGLPVPAVNNALRRMYNTGLLVSEFRRKQINGKLYPVYLYYDRKAADCMPAWLAPKVPEFTDSQIRGVTTILGLTGNLGLKAAVANHNKRRAA